MLETEANQFFGFGPYAEPEFAIRVLGRELKPTAATLQDHRVSSFRQYFFLEEDSGQEVEGQLFALQPGDVWLLDDEFGVERGDYRRKTVTVKDRDGQECEAVTYLAGPTMSLWNVGSPEITQESQ